VILLAWLAVLHAARKYAADQRQTEEQLRQSHEMFQLVLDNIPQRIFWKDTASQYLGCNHPFARDAGLDRPEDIVGKNDPELAWSENAAAYVADDRYVMTGNQPKIGYEEPQNTPGGPLRWLCTSKVPLHDVQGNVIGVLGSYEDITARKRQEEELKQRNAELERFTYTVSHDLKSPLVTVKTFLGYLEQDLARSDPERVKQDVAYMHTAAEKMGRLLDELLNLTRVGRKVNPSVRVTFQELAQEAVRLVAGRISTGGVKARVADAVVTLEGDRPRLMEIWQNLVDNACKFMGKQPQPEVEIGVVQRGPDTVFFVRDNGSGIKPGCEAKVFDLFEQLDPKGEGTGMGLALVKRIVELYKGRIWVESPGLGQGSNFLFTLPGAVILGKKQPS